MSKLTDADGEQQETQHWVEVALDCGYINQRQSVELLEKCNEIGRILGGMIEKSDCFCQDRTKVIRELDAEYFVKISEQ